MDTVADRLTIAEAAKHFGLTRDGVRKRILRGKLTGVLLDGVQYVVVDKSASPSPNGDTVHDGSATLVAQLQSENAWLRAQVEHRDTLLALALQRPALPEAPRIVVDPTTIPWWSWRRWWPGR